MLIKICFCISCILLKMQKFTYSNKINWSIGKKISLTDTFKDSLITVIWSFMLSEWDCSHSIICFNNNKKVSTTENSSVTWLKKKTSLSGDLHTWTSDWCFLFSWFHIRPVQWMSALCLDYMPIILEIASSIWETGNHPDFRLYSR